MDTSSTASNVSEGDSIKIFLRVRPPDPSISENDFAPRVIDVNSHDNAIILRTKPEPKVFTYDNVGDGDITQETVFSIVGKKIIESCVAGYNGTIFAYGQTGSGKTFTMLGNSENSDSFQHELRGVIPRSFEYLFNLIAHQREIHGPKKTFLCRCSFLEIYQEQIFDLLDPTSQGLHLRENMNKGVFVDGLVEEVIDNPTDAYQVLITGWLNRRVAATSMNRESSRSHAVFTVTIESKEDEGGVLNIRTSQLNLVDLAGSERQRDTNTGGTRLKEAGSINKSLSVLGNVIMSLVELSNGRKRHVPYRDSKLTFLLRDSLGGNTKTHMVACVHPDSRCFQESLSTLNFARSAKLIKNKAVVNEDIHGNNHKLQNEIKRLKELLEMHTRGKIPFTLPHPNFEVTPEVMSVDSIWKRKFIEAMHYREISESEKKTLQEVVSYLQELCQKKDRYIQSTRMIIKFRESSLAALSASNESAQTLERDTVVKALRDEIRLLQQQLEHNPALAKIAGQNKCLQSELKRLRSQPTLEGCLSDTQRVRELERIFKELKVYHELQPALKGGKPGSSPQQKEPIAPGLPVGLEEKHRKEVECLHTQIDKLKRRVLEVTKASEARTMEMEVELVSASRMILELERLLEAHQMKARIECNALKTLHCQTLKVMTTPSSSKHGSRRDAQAGVGGAGKGGDLPPVLAEGAHDALMEEIHSLQTENGKLKEAQDEREAEMLRMKQRVDKMDHYNKQLTRLLERERNDCHERDNDYQAQMQSLQDETNQRKKDLNILSTENNDLYLVLKSTDKKLREEKEKLGIMQGKHDKETDLLQKRLSAACMEQQATNREREDALKELMSLKEELDNHRLTVTFLESRSSELEKKANSEAKTREKLEFECKLLRGESSIQNLATLKEEAEVALKDKQAELDALRAEQDKVVTHQARVMEHSKEQLTALTERVAELTESRDAREELVATLRLEASHAVQEATQARRQAAQAQASLSAAQRQVREQSQAAEATLMAKDFEIDTLQQDQDSMSQQVLRLDQALKDATEKLQSRDMLCQSLKNNIEEYKSKLNASERSMHELISEYERKLCEFAALELGGEAGLACLLQGSQKESSKTNSENSESLRSKLSVVEKSKQALERDHHCLKEKNSQLQSRLAKQKEHVLGLEACMGEREAAFATIKSENVTLRAGLVNFQDKCHAFAQELESQEHEIQQLRESDTRLKSLMLGKRQDTGSPPRARGMRHQ